MALRFAFLVLREHPYGREMLRILLERGLRPALVVEEVSPLAGEERSKFLTRIAGQPLPPSMSGLLDHWDTPSETVPDHNHAACRDLLEALEPELVVLGGTRIIHPHILAIPGRGTVNAHPGLLPWLRGSSSVAWALYRDLPVGVTTHLVDRGIDTGTLILQRRLPVYRGQTYEQIVRGVLSLAGDLMAETLALFEAGDVPTSPQDPAAGGTLRVIPPEYLVQARTNLAQGRYSHYAD
jgi:methionyl-tRNA formyltransferase